jgi:hypothetical protein
MSKNNGDGKNNGLRNGMLLGLNEKITAIAEQQGEMLGEIKALRLAQQMANEQQTKDLKNTDGKIEKHIRDHKDKPEQFMAPLIGKIGWKGWAAISAGLSISQIAIAWLVLKLGPSKLFGIFK